MNKPATYVCLACVLLLFSALRAGGAAAAGAASGLTGWSRLELHASKLIATADAVIERWPAADPPAGGEAVVLVRVGTGMRYLGRSKTVVSYSEQPAAGGLPIRWMEIEPGRKAREWRAAPGGPLVKRRFGPPQGKSAPWSGGWSAGRTERIPLPAGPPDDGMATSLLNAWTFLARLDLVAAGPEHAVPLLGNDGLVPAVARRAGTTTLKLRVRDLDGGREIPFEIGAARIELAPAPGGPDPSVLGLTGPVTLLVDPASGALLQIQGRRDGIPGVIRFTLGGVSRTARTRPAVPWPADARDATLAP